MTDGNDRTTPGEGEHHTSSDPGAAGQGGSGGVTKRQLWVAPVIMAVNLPDSVFAQASPVGTPTMAPTDSPTMSPADVPPP